MKLITGNGSNEGLRFRICKHQGEVASSLLAREQHARGYGLLVFEAGCWIWVKESGVLLPTLLQGEAWPTQPTACDWPGDSLGGAARDNQG